MMTFGQFIEKCRAAGVTDDTPLFWIDYTPTEGQDTDVHVSPTAKNGVRITHWPYTDAEAFMDQPVSDEDREHIAAKHRSE